MSSLRWVAEGIEVAEKAGGITLERKQRAGFEGKVEIRRAPIEPLSVSGFEVWSDPDPFEDE